MPSPDEVKKINEVFTEMRTAHETLKDHVETKLKEIRKSGSPDPMTLETIEKINTDLTELRSNYDALLKASQRPNTVAAAVGEELNPEMQLRKAAFSKYLRFGMGESGRAAMSPEEIRSLSSASDTDGGFLVPSTFENDIIMDAYNDGELRQICQASPTGRDSVQMPVLAKPVVAWGVRNLAVTAQDIAAGQERLEIFDLKALTLIANNTLDDSSSDIWAELRVAFGLAVAEAEDDAFSVAPGDKMPQGVFADSRVQANFVVSGVAGALSDGSNNGVDALIAMLQTLKKTYRRNSTWAMNSTTEGIVRQFKDTNGQYLWQPPVQPGNPSTLLGRPLVNPEGIADVSANSLSIGLGDFKRGYKIRDRAGITIQRLVEKYAEYDQTGFLLKKRLGGQVVLPEAFVLMKTST